MLDRYGHQHSTKVTFILERLLHQTQMLEIEINFSVKQLITDQQGILSTT